jgi:hypothetical protein
MKECEGVRELQRPHMQNMICGCIEVQRTVWVAEALEVLLSNRPVVQCSVWVQLINISDFSQIFVCRITTLYSLGKTCSLLN